MTKTEKLIVFILFWLVVVAVTSTLLRCDSLVTDTRNESIDPVWIVIADERCWITFDKPITFSDTETQWTTREGGEMNVIGPVLYLEVVDGNMTRAYLQLGVSEEQCLNL